MSFEFKCITKPASNDAIRDRIEKHNASLPKGIIDKLEQMFKMVNRDVEDGADVFIPILPPFYGKQSEPLLTIPEIEKIRKDRKAALEEQVVEEPVIEEPVVEEPAIEEPVDEEPVVEEQTIEEPVVEEPVIEEPVVEEPTKPRELTTEEKLKNRPIKAAGKLHYRLYPYTFSRPGETIEAVVRLYNDMNVSRPVINKLVYEFTQNNADSLPPKLGQTVQIPVLLPFCFRHECNNKIFTDD